MARGFGATEGTASTDRIQTALTASGASRSYGGWFYLTGAGGGGNGRLFARDNSFGVEDLVYSEAGTQLAFFRSWSGSLGSWYITAPATGGWHHVLWVYDGSAPANTPACYLDGTYTAITPQTQPGVGETLVDVSGSAWHLGNRPTAWSRGLNGRLADWAVWSDLLIQDDATLLAAGYRAGAVHPTNLLEWIPLDDDPVTSRILSAPTVVGALVQADPAGLLYGVPKNSAEGLGIGLDERGGLWRGFGSADLIAAGLVEVSELMGVATVTSAESVGVRLSETAPAPTDINAPVLEASPVGVALEEAAATAIFTAPQTVRTIFVAGAG